MNRNELIKKLRTDFNINVRPYRIEGECSCCGSEENLILHHVSTFSDLLDETLILLNIDILNNEFTDEQYKVIKYIMRGKQLTCKVITLCPACHLEVHEEGFIHARKNYGKNRKKNTWLPTDEEIIKIEEYLEGCVANGTEFLTREDREPLIKKIGLVDEKHSSFKKGKIIYVKNIETLNTHLTSLGLDYQIVQLPRGTTRNKKRYRAIWVIEKLY